MMRKGHLFIVAMLLVMGCREPIELDFAASDPKLVIDGYITNAFRQHSVYLSFSSGFQDGIYIPVRITTANVSIEDDQGGSYNLTHVGNGEYKSVAFFAEETKAYRVVVHLEDAEYATTYERLPETTAPASDNISFEPQLNESVSGNGFVVTEQGVAINANIRKTDATVYYQWITKHWFIGEAYFAQGVYCYIEDFEVPRVVILEDKARQASEGSEFEFQIDYVPVTVKTNVDFAVEVTQLILTQEAFEFWNSAWEQAQSVGSLFDSSPFTIRGNGVNVNTGEPVLGYFGVYREDLQRIFFSEAELPYAFREFPCTPPPESPNICDECLVWSGLSNSKTKPSWWR